MIVTALFSLGFLYQENCDCPMKNSDWLKALECSTNFPELDNDMEPFPANSVNMREVEKAVHERWPKRPGNGALMHYVVKDNKVSLAQIKWPWWDCPVVERCARNHEHPCSCPGQGGLPSRI